MRRAAQRAPHGPAPVLEGPPIQLIYAPSGSGKTYFTQWPPSWVRRHYPALSIVQDGDLVIEEARAWPDGDWASRPDAYLTHRSHARILHRWWQREQRPVAFNGHPDVMFEYFDPAATVVLLLTAAQHLRNVQLRAKVTPARWGCDWDHQIVPNRRVARLAARRYALPRAWRWAEIAEAVAWRNNHQGVPAPGTPDGAEVRSSSAPLLPTQEPNASDRP